MAKILLKSSAGESFLTGTSKTSLREARKTNRARPVPMTAPKARSSLWTKNKKTIEGASFEKILTPKKLAEELEEKAELRFQQGELARQLERLQKPVRASS